MKDIPINQLVHQMNTRMKQLTYNVEENDADVDGIREELIAIKTYCDMLLQASESKPKRQAQPLAQQARPVPQAPVQQQSLSSKPMKEDDANEESIFDF